MPRTSAVARTLASTEFDLASLTNGIQLLVGMVRILDLYLARGLLYTASERLLAATHEHDLCWIIHQDLRHGAIGRGNVQSRPLAHAFDTLQSAQDCLRSDLLILHNRHFRIERLLSRVESLLSSADLSQRTIAQVRDLLVSLALALQLLRRFLIEPLLVSRKTRLVNARALLRVLNRTLGHPPTLRSFGELLHRLLRQRERLPACRRAWLQLRCDL